MSLDFDSMCRLDGKVALVTGGSRGIGRATCELLAAAGAKVVVSSRKQAACEEVAASIRDAGFEAQAIAGNVSSEDDQARIVAETEAHFGPVDVLIVNAAANPYYGPQLDIDNRALDKTFDTNLRSALRLSARVIPKMASRGSGSVIFTSSIGGLRGTGTMGAYAMSKAALMQLARNLSFEWSGKGVRVNCVAPGLVRTDFAKALYEDPEKTRAALAFYPIGGRGEPDDIAGAFLFLACEAGRFVTGQTLIVDGGATTVVGE